MCAITAYGVQCLVAGFRGSGAGQQAMCPERGMLHGSATGESRPTICDLECPGWGGESRAVTISLLPPLLVVLDRMLLALTHQSSLRTRATFSWPILCVCTYKVVQI